MTGVAANTGCDPHTLDHPEMPAPVRFEVSDWIAPATCYLLQAENEDPHLSLTPGRHQTDGLIATILQKALSFGAEAAERTKSWVRVAPPSSQRRN